MGITVSLARTGTDAVKAVQDHTFDLILMDIQMPLMDGYEATQQIRQMPHMKDTPIIAITANAMSSDRDKAFAAGMNEHIAKPIDPDNLYQILSMWLSANTNKTYEPDTSDNTDALFLELKNALPSINITAGISRIGGNQELYRKLIIQFYHDHGDALNKLINLLATPDKKSAARLVHTLKGVAGNIGAVSLQNAAIQQEKQLAESDYPKILDSFKTACVTVFDNLSSLAFKPVEQNSDEAASSTTAIDISESLGSLKKCLDEGDGNSLNLVKLIKGVLTSVEDKATFTDIEQQVSAYDFEEALTILQTWEMQRKDTVEGDSV